MFKKFTIMLMIIVFTSLIIGCGDNKTNISAETSTITETPNSEYVLEMPDSITVFPLKEDLIETGPFNTVVSEKYDELLRELIETKIPIRKGWKEPMWNSNVPEMQRVANKLPPGYERDFLILSMASLGHLPRKEPYSLPNDNDLYWYLIQNTDTPWIAGFAASRLYSSFVNSGQYEKALAIWSKSVEKGWAYARMTSDNPEHIELQKGMWGRNHGHVPFSDTEARAGIVLGPTEIYAYMGDFEKAIANCEEVISAFPNTEVANTARERLPYYQSGESRSINSYERKMKLKEKRKNRRQAQ